VKKVPNEFAFLVHKLVLFNKLKEKLVKREIPIAPEHASRYRLTTDLVPLNGLHFSKAVEWYHLNKIPVLWGSINTAPATFVYTDSNQGSWAPVFLIPIRKTEVLSEGEENADSELIKASNGLKFETILDAEEGELPELGQKAKEWTLVPVTWDGDKWPKSIQEKS